MPPGRSGRPTLPPAPDGIVHPDHERIVAAVAQRLALVTSPIQACQETVAAIGEHTPARVSVLLHVHDRLRCVAATGSWQVFATVPPGAGVVGRAYAGGRTEVVPEVAKDPDYLPLRPDAVAELCAPLPDPAGRPFGVLDLEWTELVDLERWRRTAERVTAALAERINQLDGPPAESRSEKLLRHVAELTAAPTERALARAALGAARDVSGLAVAVLLLPDRVFAVEPEPTDSTRTSASLAAHLTGASAAGASAAGASAAGASAAGDKPACAALAAAVRTALTDADPRALARLRDRAHRYGATYTLGESGHPATPDHGLLLRAGVGTLIAVPVGPADSGGVLLSADGRLLRPDPTTVNLMELLAAQAWSCLDRLRTLNRLHRRAASDPLTGLGHQGMFGERMATVAAGRTALIAIDVDDFKLVNDTYGHLAGDRVLVQIARALQAALRQGDELYRVGGDEFVAVVDVGRPEEAIGIAERLAQAARGTGRTVSVGVAVRGDGEPPEATLHRADMALYDVKRSGRDGVALATV